MPPTTAAGACTGTRLPATSVCVEIGWVVVFASLTKSVNRWSSFRAASDTLNPLAHPWRIGDASPVRRAHARAGRGGGGGAAGEEPLGAALLSELAIEVEDSLVGHRRDQEVGQRPHQGVDAVGRISRRAQGDIAVTSGHKAAHLIFELREGAEVMNPTLLVKRGHRFGPGNLVA